MPSKLGTIAIAVKLHSNSRGGSAFIWTLKPGDLVEIAAPENRFGLSWRASSYLLIAGGIGVTPIYGMARALAERNKPLRMIYGAQSRKHMAFVHELQDCLGASLQTFENARDEVFDLPKEIATLPEDGEAYVCGPIALLEAVQKVGEGQGRKTSGLRYEVFGNSGRFAEQPFEVTVAGCGIQTTVRPDQSTLEALLEAGVDMIYDCQRGECGLCVVEIVDNSSVIDHRDVFFSEAEKADSKRMCICVSRACGGSVVIDAGYRSEPPEDH